MTLAEFVTLNTGLFVEFDTMYGAQCMDLFRCYVRDVLGFEQSKGVANAWQVFYNYPAALWEKIPYKRGICPQPGDVVIWSKWYSRGLTGHIAICTEADDVHITCFSQNDPTGTPARIRKYGYTRVLGWLRPKV